MKKQINLIIRLYFICMCFAIHAQRYPVQVTQTVLPPYSSKLSDYTTATNVKFRLDVLLTDVVLNNRQVRLKLRIKGNGFDIRSRDVVSGAPQVFLNGGVLQQFTNLELGAYFQLNNLLGISPQDYNKPLPEGVYSICWEVYDVITNQQINNPATGCSDVFIILNDPPFLNLPFKGDQLVAKDPMNIIFQWTPRHTNATNVSYDFELREIWDRNIDPQAAFLASPNYYTENLRNTTLLYDISKPVLLPKKLYGWRIRAKSLTGISENSVFKNGGYSEIYYFTYTNKCDAPNFILSEALSSNSVKITWQGNFEHKKYHVQYKREDIADAEWFDVYTYNNQAQISNLKQGKTYLFRVGGTCNELNDFQQAYSYSAISQFTMPRKDEDATYNCGIIPEIDIKNLEPLQNIGINETFTAGDFPVTVKQIQGGNGVFSGKGFIVVPYLADTKIAVTFNAIKINEDYQLTDGVIRTTYDPTWGGVSDVNDVFVNDTTNSQPTTVDFVVEDVQVDPNGDIIVIGTNGEIVELPGGQDQVITDSNGQTWSVDEEGNVTKTGEVVEGGATNPENTNGVNNQGQATAITAKGVIVTFENAPDSQYGFDAYKKSDKATKDLYKKLNDDYYIPYKAVANGQTEKIIANLKITDTNIKASDIIFKTKDGIAIKKIDSTANSYTLELQGTFTDQSIETQALIKQKEKYEVAGAFIQYQAKIKEVAVVLVNASNSNTQKIKQKLEDVYQKALVKLEIKVIDDFTKDLENIVPEKTIASGESGFLEKYTEQQEEINKALKSRNDFNENAYYVILTDKKSSTSGEKGFMPLGKQFGYVYMNSGADATTVAHELGHGAFQLKHPFSSKSYGYDEATLSWLLDYDGGDKIPYVHWKEIHNPKLRFGIFDKDEDAQSVTNTMPVVLSINKKKYKGKYYYGYLTPSGERIVLSREYKPIFFHGIANDVYNNVVPGTLIGFSKKVKNAEGKIEEVKYRASIVNNEFLGYNNFNYQVPDIRDDKKKSFVMGLPYGEPDIDKGHWKNYKFNGETIPEYKGQDKPILNIVSEKFQKLGLFTTPLITSVKFLNPKKILGEGQIKITDREIKLLSGYYNSDGSQWFADLLANAGRDSYTISHNERREVFLIVKIAEIYNRYPKIFKEFTKFFNNWDLRDLSEASFNYGKWDKENLGNPASELYLSWKNNLSLKESNAVLYDFYQQFLVELFAFVNTKAEANIACLSTNFDAKTNEELYECISRASEFELRDLPLQKQIAAIKKILKTSKSGGEIADEKEIEVARLLEAISKNEASYTEALHKLEKDTITYTWEIQTKNSSIPKKDTVPLWLALFNNIEDEIFIFGEDNRQSIVKSIGKIFIGSQEYFVKQLQKNIAPEVLKSMTFADLKTLHDNFFTYENDYQNIFRRGWSDIEANAQGVNGIALYDAEDFYKSVDTKITEDNLINARQKIKWGLFNSKTLKDEDLSPFQLVSFINISKNNLLKPFTAKDANNNPQAIFIPAFTLHYASKTDALKTKSDIIQTAVDLLAFLPSGGTASLNTFGKFIYYADKISSVSSIAATAFENTDDSLQNYMNQLSIITGIVSLGDLANLVKKGATQKKLVEVVKPDVTMNQIMHADALKSTNNQVENVNSFAEKIIKEEFDLSKITKQQIDATKEILENEIKYLENFPEFKTAIVREAIAKVDKLGLEKLNITSKSVVDANLVSKDEIIKSLVELNNKNNDGFIDIVIHGEADKFILDLPDGVQELTASNLVDYIKNEKAYKGVTNFRLLTCANIELAKDFARLLPEGYTVRATDDIVRVHVDGGVTTIPREGNSPLHEWKDFKKNKDGIVSETSAKAPEVPKAMHADDFVQLGGNKAKKYKHIRIVPEGKPYPEDFVDVKISTLDPIHPPSRNSQPDDIIEKLIRTIKEDGFKVVEPGGLINPIRVIQLPDGKNIIMDGMHRVEAIKQIGEDHAPVLFTTYKKLEESVEKGMGIALLENVYYALHIGKRTGYYKGAWMPEIPNMKKWKRNEILEDVNDFMKKEFPDLADSKEGLLASLKEIVPTDELKKVFENEFKDNLKELKRFSEDPNLIDAWGIEKNVFKKNISAFPENLDFTGYNFNTGDEFIDVIIHSNSKGEFVIRVEGTEKIVSTKDLAKIIDKIPIDKKIRLLSCNTDKAAIEFSKVTSRSFYASDGVVKLYPDGTVVHDTPFKKYQRGARSDLEEDFIKPNLEPGTGKPLELGRKFEDISKDLKLLFGNKSNNVFDKIKDLEIINKKLDRLLKDFKELDGNSVKVIGERLELIDAWAVLDDIYLVNSEKKAIRKNISVLEEVEEHVSVGGGYNTWIASDAGKNKRLWTEVKLSAEFNFQKNKARNCMIKLFGGEEIGVARVEYSDVEKMLEFDVSVPNYLQSQGVTSTFIKESITKYPNATVIKDEYIASSRYDGGEPATLTAFKRELAKPGVTEQDAAFLTQSGRVYKKNGFNGVPDVLVNTPDRVVIKYGLGNSNHIPVNDVSTKVDHTSKHTLAVIHNKEGFKKITRTFNGKEYNLQGFKGVHTERALKEYTQKNGGSYAIKNIKVDENGVYRGIPILYVHDEEYVKVTSIYFRYLKGKGTNRLGGESTFFPRDWSDETIKENVVHAITNNHGVLIRQDGTSNPELLFGFSKDGKIEIRFKLKPNGTIGTYYPVPKKELKKLPNITSHATTNDVEKLLKEVLEANAGAFPKNIDLSGYQLGTNNDGVIDVIVHSNDKGEFLMHIEGQTKIVSAYTLAKLFDKIPKDQKIRLLSCNSHEAAIAVSRLTDRAFYASEGIVKLYPDGTVVHKQPFREYHKGARSDLGEIPPNTKHGKGRPIELGKLSGSPDDISRVFGKKAKKVRGKIEALDVKEAEVLLKDLESTSKETINIFIKNPDFIESWATMYHIGLERLARLDTESLDNVSKILDKVGGYKNWLTSDYGIEKRIWKKIEVLGDELHVTKLNGLREKFGKVRSYYVDENQSIKAVSFTVYLPFYLEKQGIGSEFVRLSLEKYKPDQVQFSWEKNPKSYQRGASVSFIKFKELMETYKDKVKAALGTPGGKVMQKFEYGKVLDVKESNKTVIATFGKERKKLGDISKLFGDYSQAIAKKIDELELPNNGEEFLEDFRGASKEVIDQIGKDPVLIESWKLILDKSNRKNIDFLRFFTEEYPVNSLKTRMEDEAELLKRKFPNMSIYELTVINCYTMHRVRELNKALREIDEIPLKKFIEAYANTLEKSLIKLPNYTKDSYRGTHFSKATLNKYKKAFENKTLVLEKSFGSSSKEKGIAESFVGRSRLKDNFRVLFTFDSKKGVDIEDISGYGPTFHDPDLTEAEVVHLRNTSYYVTDYTESSDSEGFIVYITLSDELKAPVKQGGKNSDLIQEVFGNSGKAINQKIKELDFSKEEAENLIKDFQKASKEVIKEVSKDPDLINGWKLMNERKSPNRTDLDFLKLFKYDNFMVSWYAVLKLPASAIRVNPNIPVEELAIVHYMTSYSSSINEPLRGVSDLTEEIIVFEKTLNKALNRYPKYTEITYRGATLEKEILKKYKKAYNDKTEIKEDAFTFSSKDISAAEFYLEKEIKRGKTRVFFTIRGKNGVDIEKSSAGGPSYMIIEGDQEVLFKSKTKFKVVGYKPKINKALKKIVYITLEEL